MSVGVVLLPVVVVELLVVVVLVEVEVVEVEGVVLPDDLLREVVEVEVVLLGCSGGGEVVDSTVEDVVSLVEDVGSAEAIELVARASR